MITIPQKEITGRAERALVRATAKFNTERRAEATRQGTAVPADLTPAEYFDLRMVEYLGHAARYLEQFNKATPAQRDAARAALR